MTVGERHKPRRSARQLARLVEDGRYVAEALRHLHVQGDEPDAILVAEALARFLVARCESHHAGWRVIRQIVVDTSADVPWEKCARRAIPLVADDLLSVPGRRGAHAAAQGPAHRGAPPRGGDRPHLDQAAILADLGLEPEPLSDERWREVLTAAIGSRSREQVSRGRPRAAGLVLEHPALVVVGRVLVSGK